MSLQSLVGIMNHIAHDERGRVRRGAILIMHMSSTAKLTPKALDILLTANDKLPEASRQVQGGSAGGLPHRRLRPAHEDGQAVTSKTAEISRA